MGPYLSSNYQNGVDNVTDHEQGVYYPVRFSTGTGGTTPAYGTDTGRADLQASLARPQRPPSSHRSARSSDAQPSMEFEITCQCCDRSIECDGDDDPDAAVDCECGARYAVTISLIRGA